MKSAANRIIPRKRHQEGRKPCVYLAIFENVNTGCRIPAPAFLRCGTPPNFQHGSIPRKFVVIKKNTYTHEYEEVGMKDKNDRQF